MIVAVVDGQGGGIGKVLVDRIRRAFCDEVEIWAFGTNSMATAQMLKAGADEGATGENALVQNIGRVDVIVGTLAIVLAHSMMGEMTPRMAEAVAASRAIKLLLPLNRSGVTIVGVKQEPLPHLADEMVVRLREIIQERRGGSGV